MADIIRVDYTDETATLEAMAKIPMQVLQPLEFSTNGSLASGLTEELGGSLYVVDAGDVAIGGTLTSSVDNSLLLVEDGDGTASATWNSSGVPTWSPTKHGYYDSILTTSKVLGIARPQSPSTYSFYRYDDYRYKTLDKVLATNAIIDENINVGGAVFSESSRTDLFAPKTAQSTGTTGELTKLYEHSNVQTTSSATYTKLLEIEVGASVTFYTHLLAFAGIGSGTAYMALYKNGGLVQETSVAVSGVSIGGLDIILDVSVNQTDTLEIWGKTTAGSTVSDPKIELSIYDIFGIARSTTENL